MTMQKDSLSLILTQLKKIDLMESNASNVTDTLNEFMKKTALTPEEQNVLQTIVSIITNTIAVRRLSKDRIVESQIINELNLNIITTLEENKIIKQIETAARKMLATDKIHLYYLLNDRLISTGKDMPLARIPTEFHHQIFKDRHIFTSHYPKHRFLNRILGTRPRQVTFVPVMIKNEAHGFFMLFEDPAKYTWSTVITRIRFLANQASIALERVELIRALNMTLRERQELQDAFKMIFSPLELSVIFNVLVRQAQKITGFNRVLLSIYDPSTESFVRTGHAGISAGKFRKAKGFRPPLTLINTLFQNHFRLSNSFYVPASKVPAPLRKFELYKSPARFKERVANVWSNGDVLISPIYSRKHDLLGYLSFDEPVGNLAPTMEKIKLLETIGDFISLVIENNQVSDRIQQLVNIDELTGLNNYRFLRDTMTSLIKNDASPFSIAMIDLDDFKKYNDEQGHLQGDEFLKDISRRLVEMVGRDGHVTRYAADEFIILLPGADSRSALHFMKRIIHLFAQEREPGAAIDFSFGIASFPEDGVDFGQLIDHADKLVRYEKERKNDETRS